MYISILTPPTNMLLLIGKIMYIFNPTPETFILDNRTQLPVIECSELREECIGMTVTIRPLILLVCCHPDRGI